MITGRVKKYVKGRSTEQLFDLFEGKLFISFTVNQLLETYLRFCVPGNVVVFFCK